jgi:hypothetical protein
VLSLIPRRLVALPGHGVAVGEHDPGDRAAERLLDVRQGVRAAAVLDDVVQERADRLVLVAVHLEHERGDGQQVRGVRHRRALAQLLGVVRGRVAQGVVEALGQQRRVGEVLGHSHGRIAARTVAWQVPVAGRDAGPARRAGAP